MLDLNATPGNMNVTLMWNNPNASIDSIDISYKKIGSNDTPMTVSSTHTNRSAQNVQKTITRLDNNVYYNFTVNLTLSDSNNIGNAITITEGIGIDSDNDGIADFIDVCLIGECPDLVIFIGNNSITGSFDYGFDYCKNLEIGDILAEQVDSDYKEKLNNTISGYDISNSEFFGSRNETNGNFAEIDWRLGVDNTSSVGLFNGSKILPRNDTSYHELGQIIDSNGSGYFQDEFTLTKLFQNQENNEWWSFSNSSGQYEYNIMSHCNNSGSSTGDRTGYIGNENGYSISDMFCNSTLALLCITSK